MGAPAVREGALARREFLQLSARAGLGALAFTAGGGALAGAGGAAQRQGAGGVREIQLESRETSW